MQTSTIAAVAAFGAALVALAVYHFIAVVPRVRSLAGLIGAHDDLLGSGSGGAAQGARGRLSSLEEAAERQEAEMQRCDRRLSALEQQAQYDVSRVGFVRFNAYADTGSDLSYALALLNRQGDGVVVSSIFSREDTRTFGKAVSRFEPLQDASKEELSAIALARDQTVGK